MISDIVAILEALDPLELVICKMSTTFAGQFTVEDLVASWRPIWNPDTRYVEQLRVLCACNRLVKRGILTEVEVNAGQSYDPESGTYSPQPDSPTSRLSSASNSDN